jgi:hypothetical protein
VCVRNPFTGSLILFVAPMPIDWRLAAAMVCSSPTLVLASVVSDRVYREDPQCDTFSFEWHTNSAACRLPLIALDESNRCSPFFFKHRQPYSDANNNYNQLWSDDCR